MLSFIDHQIYLTGKKTFKSSYGFLKAPSLPFPSLSLFNDDQILEFHSGVLNLIQTIKRHNSDRSNNISQHWYK